MSGGLDAAYEYCRALTRHEAGNFYYGFLLLPAPQRRAIYAAYAFARECDDIVDGGPATRFVKRLVELIESGYGLNETDAEGMQVNR